MRRLILCARPVLVKTSYHSHISLCKENISFSRYAQRFFKRKSSVTNRVCMCASSVTNRVVCGHSVIAFTGCSFVVFSFQYAS